MLVQAPGESPRPAAPGQPLLRDLRIEAGAAGGAELELLRRARLWLEPRGLLVIGNLAARRSVGEINLLDGALRAEVIDATLGPLLLRTPVGEIRLRGKARVEVTGRERVLISMYEGVAVARVGRTEREVRAPSGGVLQLTRGQGRRGVGSIVLRPLPAAPAWEAGDEALALALGSLDDQQLLAAPSLRFMRVAGAEQYLVEVAADPRFLDRRAGGEVVGPPLAPRLLPGAYQARVSALDEARLAGPPGPPRLLQVVGVRSDAEQVLYPGPGSAPVAAPILWHRGSVGRLRISAPGLALRAVLDGGAARSCSPGCELTTGPGHHQLLLNDEGASARLQVWVVPTSAPPPPPALEPVEPPDVPVPLTAMGFPLQPLHPRTRGYAQLSAGALPRVNSASDAPDVYRLDLGADVALLRRRVGLSVNLPVLYQTQASAGGALGDLTVGLRGLAVSALAERLSLGPLLRLQAPTGTFARTEAAQARPVILDVALGAVLRLGRVGLLTTQGLTALLSPSDPRLQWSMGYGVQVSAWRLSLAAEVDAALRLDGAAQTGVSLAGGARLSLGAWRLLAGGRGAFDATSAALFGRYLGTLGVEWVYR